MAMKPTSRDLNAPRRVAPLAVGLVALIAAFLSATVATAAEPKPGYREWEQQMQIYFDARPELKSSGEERGTGWEPFNRFKWFQGQRVAGGAEIPADGRWNAFLRKQELELRGKSQATATWFALGPENFAGRILALAFDPSDTNILYAGAADGGIWKSTDGGVSWAPLDDELPVLAVNAIAVSPLDPNIIVIGTGEATLNIDRVGGVGILRTTDGGATWLTTSHSFGIASGSGVHCMEANPFTGTFLAGTRDSLFRSTDNGATWAGLRDGNWSDIKYKPGSADTVYAVRAGQITGDIAAGVRWSTDDGANWVKRSSGLPAGVLAGDIGKCKLAVSAANREYVYLAAVSIATNDLLGLYRSTNSTATWTLRTSTPGLIGGQGWYNLSLGADPNDAEKVIMGGTPLNRSVNGGTSFSGIGGGVHVDHHAIAYRPGTNDNVFVGTDGGIWESLNDGTAWSDRNVGLNTYQFYDICVSQPNANLSLGGTQDQGTDRWTGTTTWANGIGADGMVCNCAPSDVNRVYGEIQSGDHRRSDAGGVSGSFFSINNGITGTGSWVTPVDLDPVDEDHLYTATTDGLFRTLDGGLNWTNVLAGFNAVTISISPVDGNIVWAYAGGNVSYTTDDGANWTTAAPFGFTVPAATRILTHPTDSQTAVVTFGTYSSGAHIARTTDLGATWEDRTGDFVIQPINAIAIDPQNPTRWFIGTDVGVWASGTEGQVWVPFETGFPNVVVADLEIQDSSRKLRAGTHGRGAWEVDITSPGTGVTPPSVPLAIGLMLDPPSPNPLRDGTVLRYAARTPGNLSLRVYDVQGRLVTTLADRAADGLIREVIWNPGNVSDGVYFARLTSGGQEKTQKLVVVQ